MNNHAKNQSANKGFRGLLLFVIAFVFYSIGFIPPIVVLRIVTRFISFGTWLDIVIVPPFIAFEIGLTLLSQLLISGALQQLFGLKYEEGSFSYLIEDDMAFKWMIVCGLYTPFRKIMEIIPMGRFRQIYLRMLGMKIGDNTLVGGTIKDPCVTELGSNVTIGEYAVLYGHIQNTEKQTLYIKKIKVGDNCVIGAGAIIMPGVTLEDNVVVAAGSLVPKNSVLKKGKIYAGHPVKELKSLK